MSPNPRGDTAVRWIIALGVIDTLAVMVRFFARKKNGTKIAADDWMIMASLVPAYCMIASAILAVSKGGLGKHKADVTDSEEILLFKYIIPAIITYCLTITAVKISILLLYRRVFDIVTFKRAILVVGCLCNAWLCCGVFPEIFFCSPMSAAWDPKLRFSNHCGNHKAFFTGMTASGLFLDLIILIMPLPMIWNLMLSTRKKLEVSGVFLLGSFTCISSLIRILSIDKIEHEDVTYTFLNTYLWSHIEPATAIWCACLMTYRPLFRDVGLKLRSIFGYKRQTPSNNKTFFGRKARADTNSDAWPSRGQLLRGQESVGFRDLSTRTATKKLYVVNVFMEPSPPDHHSAPPADEHERSRFAAGRESSPV